jgi:hypothetical protein
VEIVQAATERRTELAIVFEPAATLQEFLRGRLIFPEIRQRDALFDFGEFYFGAGPVKDGSAGRWPAGLDPRTCEAVRLSVGP